MVNMIRGLPPPTSASGGLTGEPSKLAQDAVETLRTGLERRVSGLADIANVPKEVTAAVLLWKDQVAEVATGLRRPIPVGTVVVPFESKKQRLWVATFETNSPIYPWHHTGERLVEATRPEYGAPEVYFAVFNHRGTAILSGVRDPASGEFRVKQEL